jgi:hypothetical protein
MVQGCTSILYDELEARQREDCYKRIDPAEVQKCLKDINMTHDKSR